MPRFFGIPFGTSGDRTTVPDPAQGDGSVSFTEGYTFDYERPNTDPNYKPIGRQEWNGIMHDVTEAVGDIQKQGVADWMEEAVPYAIGARVRHNDQNWISSIDNNSATPETGSSWRLDGAAATETVSGSARVATQAEVNAGVLDDVLVTPKKLRMGFSSAFGTSSYVALPTWLGGWILQFGQVSITGTTISVSYPIAFPTACRTRLCNHGTANDEGGVFWAGTGVYGGDDPKSMMRIFIRNSGGGIGGGASFFWLAIGN